MVGAHEGAQHRTEADAERDHTGDEAADPAALARGHEFLDQRKIDAIEAADTEAHEEAHDGDVDPAVLRREVEQAGGDREVQHGADEHLAAADAVGEPAPDVGAEDGAHPGRQQHDGGLSEGQLPRPDQERENEADEKVVEEFECVADHRRGDDLLLVAGQLGLPVENVEHGISPVRFILDGCRALHRVLALTLRLGASDRQDAAGALFARRNASLHGSPLLC